MTLLAAQLDGVAEQLVGDVVVWGRVVSTCRNESTHLDGDREEDDSPDLFYLAEGVFNVMRLCLLLHAGMDRAMLPKVANSRPASAVTTNVDRVGGWASAQVQDLDRPGEG